MSLQSLVISDLKITSLSKCTYVKPLSLTFKQNGRSRTWDMIKAYDSVVIVIFNVSRQVLVLVKQFRPAVYFCSVPDADKKDGIIDTNLHPPSSGITLEFCAGNVDKNKPVVEIAKEEVLEECGYDVPVNSFEKFKVTREGIGTEGSLLTYFYVEVTDEMRVSQGGGLADEGELIEVVEMTITEAEAYVDMPENVSPGSFCFALLWFLRKKAPGHKIVESNSHSGR